MEKIERWSLWVWNYHGSSRIGLTTCRPKQKGGTSALSKERSETFLVRVVTEDSATARTNPIVWWLVVLIQTEVVESQPVWTVAELKDELDFPHKVQAIDHYRRILILDIGYSQWIRDRSPQWGGEDEKQDMRESLNEVNLDWIDQDQDRLQMNMIDNYQELRQYHSPVWTMCMSCMYAFLSKWLRDETIGPMADVIRLHLEKLVLFRLQTRYAVKAEIYEGFPRNTLSATPTRW
jgi:hypothetical protein